jgi:hypothetical protein
MRNNGGDPLPEIYSADNTQSGAKTDKLNDGLERSYTNSGLSAVVIMTSNLPDDVLGMSEVVWT